MAEDTGNHDLGSFAETEDDALDFSRDATQDSLYARNRSLDLVVSQTCANHRASMRAIAPQLGQPSRILQAFSEAADLLAIADMRRNLPKPNGNCLVTGAAKLCTKKGPPRVHRRDNPTLRSNSLNKRMAFTLHHHAPERICRKDTATLAVSQGHPVAQHWARSKRELARPFPMHAGMPAELGTLGR